MLCLYWSRPLEIKLGCMNQNELDTPGPEFPVRSDKVPANKTGVQGEGKDE